MAVQAGQLCVAALFGLLAVAHGARVQCRSLDPAAKNVYSFNATNIYENETIQFSRYQGKVLAIMNVATYWGLNVPHYTGMNAYMSEFSSSGFQVLGFPSNIFDLLEPADTGMELMNGIKWVRPGGGFVPKFPIFKKIDVNGKNEHPLYTYLKEECGPTADEFEDDLFYDPKKVNDVRWNYEVFLINKNGRPVYRYAPDDPVANMRTDIMKLLNGPIVESNNIPAEAPYQAIYREEREELTNEIEEKPDYVVPEDFSIPSQ